MVFKLHFDVFLAVPLYLHQSDGMPLGCLILTAVKLNLNYKQRLGGTYSWVEHNFLAPA